MVSELFRKLDSHLSESEVDSQEWADGLGSTMSVEMLSEFQREDWVHISKIWKTKKTQWRECFVSSLHPGLGADAECLLILALEDLDTDVAFLALGKISFYCGVNDGNNGPFEDKSILNMSFKERVRGTDSVIEKIKSISVHCAPFLQARHKLLITLLAQ